MVGQGEDDQGPEKYALHIFINCYLPGFGAKTSFKIYSRNRRKKL